MAHRLKTQMKMRSLKSGVVGVVVWSGLRLMVKILRVPDWSASLVFYTPKLKPVVKANGSPRDGFGGVVELRRLCTQAEALGAPMAPTTLKYSSEGALRVAFKTGQAQTVDLAGVTLVPMLAASPSSHDFGVVHTEESAVLTVFGAMVMVLYVS